MKSILIAALFIMNLFFTSSLWAENDLSEFEKEALFVFRSESVRESMENGILSSSERDRKMIVFELAVISTDPRRMIRAFFQQNPHTDLINVKLNSEAETYLPIAMIALSEKPEKLVEAIEAMYAYSNIDPNAQYKGNAALHLAVQMRRGAKQVIQALYKNPDLDPNVRTARGETALHLTFDYLDWNPIEVIEALFEHPDIDFNARNKRGHTPLELLEGSQPRIPGVDAWITALWRAKEQEAKAFCYVN